MPSRFERPDPNDDKSQKESEVEFFDYEAHLAGLEALTPSGDVLADARTHNALCPDHTFARQVRTESEAIRYFVVLRDIARGVLDSPTLEDPSSKRYWAAEEATSQRVLAFYKRSEETLDSFDDAQVRDMSAPLGAIRQGLQSFHPTGDIRADAWVFVAMTPHHHPLAPSELASGTDPAELLTLIRELNLKLIAEGIQPNQIAEDRNRVRELARIENEVIDLILSKAGSSREH